MNSADLYNSLTEDDIKAGLDLLAQRMKEMHDKQTGGLVAAELEKELEFTKRLDRIPSFSLISELCAVQQAVMTLDGRPEMMIASTAATLALGIKCGVLISHHFFTKENIVH